MSRRTAVAQLFHSLTLLLDVRPLLRYWIVQVHEVKDEEAYGKYVGKVVETIVQSRRPTPNSALPHTVAVHLRSVHC